MPFEIATPGRVIFGRGTSSQVPTIAAASGRHALIIGGRDPVRARKIADLLARERMTTDVWSITHEPAVDDIERGVAFARSAGVDHVIGIGGGSVLDAAKAIAALAPNDGPILDYLEVIGRAAPLTRPSLPCIALPTTAGTGAEVTRNAVLSAPAQRVKVSLRGPTLLPRVAIVDSELTHGLPPPLTASTGLDALTQLIEPYVCSRANPLSDGWCREGLRQIATALPRAVEHGDDASAREAMALASLLGGLALANAGLGAVHGFAGPLGGAFPIPHGVACAALLPHVVAANLHALSSRAPGHGARVRYDEIGRLVTGRPQATADDLVAWLHALVGALGAPRLSAYGMTAAAIPGIVAAAARASSMKANPVALTPDECAAILEAAL